MTIERRTPLKRSTKPIKRTALKRGAVRLKRTVFRTGKPKISKEWQQVRRFVEGRANGKCEANTPACPPGSHRGEHAHHRVLRAQQGSDDPSNLLWVCALAHDHIHLHPEESYAAGWMIRGVST